MDPFEWSDGKRVEERLTCSDAAGSGLSISSYTDFYNVDLKVWNYEGSIFDLLKQFSGAPFNELYVDTGDTLVSLHGDGVPFLNQELNKDQVHIIYRPTPYSDRTIIDLQADQGILNKLDINDLPGHTITDYDIVDKSLGFNTKNTYSIYSIIPMANMIGETDGQMFIPPLYDPVALNKYGHKPLEIKIGGWDTNKDDNFADQGRKLEILAKTWFQNNERYLEGHFKIKGKSEVRIGHRLDYKSIDVVIEERDEEGYYYINAVDNEWEYGNEFVTRIGVNRGTTNILSKDFNKQVINIREFDRVGTI